MTVFMLIYSMNHTYVLISYKYCKHIYKHLILLYRPQSSASNPKSSEADAHDKGLVNVAIVQASLPHFMNNFLHLSQAENLIHLLRMVNG